MPSSAARCTRTMLMPCRRLRHGATRVSSAYSTSGRATPMSTTNAIRRQPMKSINGRSSAPGWRQADQAEDAASSRRTIEPPASSPARAMRSVTTCSARRVASRSGSTLKPGRTGTYSWAIMPPLLRTAFTSSLSFVRAGIAVA